jgi:hypothetical protein
MATMPLRQVAQPHHRHAPKARTRSHGAEAHWFFVLGFFLAYAICRMLT